MTDKETAREAWLEGYKLAKNVEEVSGISMKVAEDRFERWWQRNHSE